MYATLQRFNLRAIGLRRDCPGANCLFGLHFKSRRPVVSIGRANGRYTWPYAVQVMSEDASLSRSYVEAAHKIIKPFVHETPVFTSSSLSAALPGKNTLYFKAENLQKGGAFKFRGASHSLERLTPEQLKAGVCTHSSGRFPSLHRAVSRCKSLQRRQLHG